MTCKGKFSMKVGTGSLVLFGPTLLHLTSTCCVWGPPQFASDDGRIGGGGGGQDGCMGRWNLSGQKAWLR